MGKLENPEYTQWKKRNLGPSDSPEPDDTPDTPDEPPQNIGGDGFFNDGDWGVHSPNPTWGWGDDNIYAGMGPGRHTRCGDPDIGGWTEGPEYTPDQTGYTSGVPMTQELRKTADLYTNLTFSDRYKNTWGSPGSIHEQAQDLRTQLETIYATSLTTSERDEIAKERLGPIPETADIQNGPLSQRAKEYRRDQEIGRFWLENAGEVTGESGPQYTTIFGPHMQEQTTGRATQIAELRPELVDSKQDVYDAALENPGGNRGAFGLSNQSTESSAHPTATLEQMRSML